MISPAQVKAVYALLRKSGVDTKDSAAVAAKIHDYAPVEHVEDLSMGAASEVIGDLNEGLSGK